MAVGRNENGAFISVKIGTREATVSIKKINKELESVGATAEKMSNTIKEAMSDVAKETASGVDSRETTKEYQELEKELEKLGAQYDRIAERENKFRATGGKEKSRTYKGMEYDLDTLESKMDSVIAKMREMEESGTAYVPDTSAEKAIEEEGKSAEEAAQKVKQLDKAQKSANKSASRGTRIFSSLADKFRKQGKSIQSSFKNLLKYTIGIRSLFVLSNKLRSALTEGFNNLAQFNNGANPTNEALSRLKSSLTQLKNSFATAFAPILTVVEPILTSLISKLTAVANAIGMVMAKLTGAKTFTKAVAVQEDYAKSLSGTAGAAKDAKKALDKYLSPLDEVNKLQEKTDSSSSGGGSVSPNDMFQEVAIPNEFGNFADMIKEAWNNADFTEIGSILGSKIKDGLDSIDWESIKNTLGKVGQSIATLLNGVLSTEGLGESIGKSFAEGINSGIELSKNFINVFNFESLGKFLGDSINGIFNTVDWIGLGETLGKGLSGLFTTIKTFFDTANWKDIGSSIVKGIKSFFANIKWGEISGAISSAFSSLLDFMSGAIQEVDWQSLPKDILNAVIDFVKGFDFNEIASSFAELLGSAIGAVAGLVVGIGKMVVDIVNKIKTAWSEKKKEWESMGISVWDGVKLGIKNAIKNIGTWIKTNIFEPFIKGFKKAFGINSPSTVMQTQGGYITQGLLNGIKNIPAKVKAIFESMKKSVISVMTKLGSALKVPINVIIRYINSMISGITSGMNTVIRTLNRFKINSPSWFEKLTGVGSIGFNLNEISPKKIPYLASGAVIPANKQFLAMLGDQKNGTNLEAPEGLIRKIVREESGSDRPIVIHQTVELDGHTVFQRMIEIGKSQQTINARNPFELA